MRTRLFVITSLVVVAVAGMSSTTAAHAAPKGPGDIGQAPATTTPPQQPKDKVAPKPTPTTTVPGPKGPGDLAPAPKGDGEVEPVPADHAPEVASVPEAAPVPEIETAEPVASAPAEATSEGFPPMLLVLAAALVGAILALVLSRSRRDDEGVAQL